MKNHRKRQEIYEHRGFTASLDKSSNQRKRYKSLKSKIEEWQLKCIFEIDLKKTLHYKWEIVKIEKRFNWLPTKVKKQLINVKESLTKIIVELESRVDNTIKEIRDCSGKWCFDENVEAIGRRLFDEIKHVDSQCEKLRSSILEEFSSQVSKMVHEIRVSVIGISWANIMPFEMQEIKFQNPDLAKYNKMDKVEWKKRNAFMVNEIRLLIKK